MSLVPGGTGLPRRRWPMLLALMLIALGTGCSTTVADVTGSAGSPAPTRAGVSIGGGAARTVATAPACRGWPDPAGQGLPCLGPGDPVDIHALEGPTVVSVWASWCGPCRTEMPVLQQYAAAGGSVLGVDVADRAEAAAALLQDLGVTYPSVQDPDSATRVDLGWVGPPLNLVVVGGQVVYRFDRPVTSVTQLRAAVRQATGG